MSKSHVPAVGQATEVPGRCPGQAARLICAEGPEGTGCAFPPETPAGPDVPLLGRASDGHTGRRVEPDCWRGSTVPACLPVLPVPPLPTVSYRPRIWKGNRRRICTQATCSDSPSRRLCAHGPCSGSGAQDEARAPGSGKARAPRPAWGLLSR